MMTVHGYKDAQPFANKVVGHFVQFAAVGHITVATGTDCFVDGLVNPDSNEAFM